MLALAAITMSLPAHLRSSNVIFASEIIQSGLYLSQAHFLGGSGIQFAIRMLRVVGVLLFLPLEVVAVNLCEYVNKKK